MCESREALPTQPNYRQIFFERLNALPTLSPRLSRLYQHDLEPFGIKTVQRSIPSLLIRSELNSTAFDLWVPDKEYIRTNLRHQVIVEDFEDFHQDKGYQVPAATMSVELFEDVERDIHLIIGEESVSTFLGSEESFQSFAFFIDHYNVKTVIGEFPSQNVPEDQLDFGTQRVVLINSQKMGEWRTDRYLHEKALQFGMTNTQYNRFRIEVLSMQADRQQTFVDDIAQKMIDDTRGYQDS